MEPREQRHILYAAIAAALLLNVGILIPSFPSFHQRFFRASRTRTADSPEDRDVPRTIARVTGRVVNAMALGGDRWQSTAIAARCWARASWKEAGPMRYSFMPPKSFQGRTIYKVRLPGDRKFIALTFDDGPWSHTLPILDILQEHNIKATFFWVGAHLAAFPKIAQKVLENGHEVGNHTWSHQYHQMGWSKQDYEIGDLDEYIREKTGVRTGLFRPPGGHLYNGLASYAASHDYVVAMWSIDSRDYMQASAGELADTVIRQAHPGAIVLLHDGGGDREMTVRALPRILDELEAQGYQFVTLSELMEIETGASYAECHEKPAIASTDENEKGGKVVAKDGE